MANNIAVVLLSGGLDSATALYFARHKGFKCRCLIFDYGQRHSKEIESAKRIAKRANCPYYVLKINLPWKGSSLVDKKIKIPDNLRTRALPAGRQELANSRTIPPTYVPGRNIIFLSFALSYAEAIKAKAIFIGAHTQDYSGYPDCRPAFFNAFKKVVSSGTKAGVYGKRIQIKAPLINKTKADIIRLGVRLGVPFHLTWSCYKGGKKPCGECDSCYYRAKGFREASMQDSCCQ